MSRTIKTRIFLTLGIMGEEAETEIGVMIRYVPPGPPGGTWNRQIGTWEPPDQEEAELLNVWPEPSPWLERLLSNMDWVNIVHEGELLDNEPEPDQ